MWQQIYLSYTKLKFTHWWQQHLVGVGCLAMTGLLFWLYWLFANNNYHQKLQLERQEQLKLQTNRQHTLIQQISLKQAYEPIPLSSTHQQPQEFTPNIINHLLQHWPINYTCNIEESSGKIYWKIENMLPAEKLSLFIEQLFEQLHGKTQFKLSLKAHSEKTNWIQFIMEFNDD